MTDFRTLDDLDVAGKRVLVRADLNVPVRDGAITDMTRIRRFVPTLKDLVAKGARVAVLSHFGRPRGKAVPEMSLEPLVGPLSEALGQPVSFARDCIGPAAADAIDVIEEGGVVLLENVRFHPGEEANDPEFAKALAALGDIYVNDAFSAAHRAHASTEALALLLPAAAGRLMQAELEALGRALEKPERPLAAVVGGAKISTKLDLLANLSRKVDQLIVGGGMANTFLNAIGKPVGISLCEHDMADTARDVIAAAKEAGCEIVLPVDAAVAGEFKAGAASAFVPVDAVPDDKMILDIGPKTIADLESRLEGARTLVWNGPLGAFEIAPFDRGTTAVARAAARLTGAGKLVSVAGGGDTVAALAHAEAADGFTYVSSAGGAFLEWLEGKALPGVAALRRQGRPRADTA